MPLPKLALSPDSNGYTAKPGVTVATVKLDGGASRFRSDKLGASHSVVVQWSIGPQNYDYLLAFFRTATKNGALPFLIDLVIDSHTPAEYTAYFAPDTFGLTAQSGFTYVVGATLEVVAKLPTTEADNAIIATGPVS